MSLPSFAGPVRTSSPNELGASSSSSGHGPTVVLQPKKIVSRQRHCYTLREKVDIWAGGMGLAVLEPVLVVSLAMSLFFYAAVVKYWPGRVDNFMKQTVFYTTGK
ncbi:hypothetical protein OIV83_002040 [Microbotryomycetes sp. JL201]|nr:hypothetical protein OIV83_002040 [Microbotryomycetes sp. JL201]